MDNLEKIDLSAGSKTTVSSSPTSPKKSRLSSKTLIVLLVFTVFLGVFVLGVVLPLQRVYASARKTYTQAKVTWEAVKKQNIELADKELVKTRQSLDQTANDLHTLSYLRFIPLASGYYNDADHLVNAGFSSLDAAAIVIDSIEPYADVLGLKGQGSFVMGSAEQRIQTAILTMGKITPRIDEVAEAFTKAQKEIDQVDTNHYPPIFGGQKIRDQLILVQQLTDDGVGFVNDARPLIKVLPTLLGEKEDKKYLVLFQNDKELRPTGGFITAYAIFRLNKGIIHVEASDDIYNLDNSVPRKSAAPRPIREYLPKVSTFNLRDSNLSPDFIESIETFNSMYAKIPGRVDVDGIIAIDTHVLVSTIKILDDDVVASGIRFNTKTDPRCDCPQVIYELEDNISRPVNFQKSGRKDLLGSLLYAIMDKALRSSPKLYWGPLFQDMLKQTSEKHILFALEDENAQIGIEALNAAGRIRSYEGDYLHINQANFGGAKSNLFVDEQVNQDITVKDDGSLTKTITIHYKNPHPPSDCNLERGGLCLNATLRDWIRIYTPKGSRLIDSKGSEVKITSYEELDKTVFEGFLTVRPQGSATFTLQYSLPFKLGRGSTLPFLIQKQPGTDKNAYTVAINGKTVKKLDLVIDTEIQLKP